MRYGQLAVAATGTALCTTRRRSTIVVRRGEAGGTESLGKARFQVLSTKNYGTTVPRPPKMSGTSAIDYQGGQRDGNHSYRNTGIVADRRASDLAL